MKNKKKECKTTLYANVPWIKNKIKQKMETEQITKNKKREKKKSSARIISNEYKKRNFLELEPNKVEIAIKTETKHKQTRIREEREREREREKKERERVRIWLRMNISKNSIPKSNETI